MKKRMISLLLVLALAVGICPAAFAVEEQLEEETIANEVSYYKVNDKKYVDVADKTYLYLTGEDFKPVDDLEVVQMLKANGVSGSSPFATYASDALPVPPTYSYDLANGSYSGSVDLSNGSQWSPLFKRDVPKRYTNFSVDTVLTKTVSIGYFYYNAFEKKWYGAYINDMKFNILINMRQLQFGTMGEAAEGLRILFFDYDNSSQSFDYTVKDTNILA